MSFRLLPLLLSAVTLSAAPITMLSYTIIGTGTNLSLPGQLFEVNNSLALISNASTGFAFSGNAVLFGAGTPITLNQEFDGPLEFRFTDALISCTGDVACSGDIGLEARLFFSTAASALPVFAGIEGTATGNPLSGVMEVDSTIIGPRRTRPIVGPGNVTIVPSPSIGPLLRLTGSSLPVEPVFSYSFPSATAIPIASNLTLLLNLSFDNLSPGSTISLPNSAWLALGQPTSSAIPEPGTILLLTAGMAGLLWFRRR
jgi:hypothetical protein